ncbi:hypothetical protein [Microvirga massiliensis]|uniref:hypothetical protein n=1 Tax=Microvirga massiliensis TaxID=1033741 RepID=UPI000AC9FF62|nr:hypothetical protein [Microvirga massiliensis]
MTEAPRGRGFDAQARSSRASDRAGTPTVASLGLQVRLIPIDQHRERELERLIASCEILRTECERLFRRTIELLYEERCRVQDSDGPSSSLDL